MKKIKRTRLSVNRETLIVLSDGDLGAARGGVRNDSLDEKSCNPCGDWPTSPYLGCTLAQH